MYIALFLLCTVVHMHTMQAADQSNTIALFNSAHNEYQKALTIPDPAQKIMHLQTAQKQLEECQPAGSTESVISLNKGLVALELAHSVESKKKKRSYVYTAQELFEQSTHPVAQYNLGRIWHTGLFGTPQNPLKAFDWYQQALQGGMAQAYTNLLSLKQQHSKQLADQALPEPSEEIKKQSKQTLIGAYNQAQAALSTGNTDQALVLLEKVSSAESPLRPLALFEQGQCLFQQNEFPASAELFIQAFNDRSVVIQQFDSLDFTQKLSGAICQLVNTWYIHADKKTKVQLPQMDAKTHHTIEQLLLLPAQEKYAEAQYCLGIFHRTRFFECTAQQQTQNTKYHFEQELAWLQKAAEQAHLPAMRECALALQTRDKYDEAKKLLTNAATELNDKDAQRMLAEWYVETSQDTSEMKKWYTRAAEQGCVLSEVNLLSLEMSDEQKIANPAQAIEKINLIIAKLDKETEESTDKSIQQAYDLTRKNMYGLLSKCYQERTLEEVGRACSQTTNPNTEDFALVHQFNMLCIEACKKSNITITAEHYYNYAIIEKRIGNTTEMCKLLFEALKRDALHASALTTLGDNYLEIEQFALAKNCFEKAAKLDNANAQLSLGFMLQQGYGFVQNEHRGYECTRQAITEYQKDVQRLEKIVTDRSQSETARTLHTQQLTVIQSKLSQAQDLAKCAQTTRPTYLTTVDDKDLAGDFLCLSLLSTKKDGSGAVALGRLYEHIFEQPATEKKRLLNILLSIQNFVEQINNGEPFSLDKSPDENMSAISQLVAEHQLRNNNSLPHNPLLEDDTQRDDLLKKKAYFWYSKAAKMGNIEGLYRVCTLQLNHNVVLEQGLEYTKQRTKQHIESLMNKSTKNTEFYHLISAYDLMGQWHEQWGVDPTAAWQFYQMAANFGSTAPHVVVPSACIKMGQKYLAENDEALAVKYFKKAAPHSAYACLQLGKIHFEQSGLHTLPEDVANFKGHQYTMTEEQKAALASARRHLSQGSSSPSAEGVSCAHLMGKIAAAEHDIDHAKKYFNKAIELFRKAPHFAKSPLQQESKILGEVHESLALLHEQDGDFENTVHHHNLAAQHGNPNGYWSLGALCQNGPSPDPQDTRTFYNEALKLDPNHPAALNNLARLNQREQLHGNHAECLDMFKRSADTGNADAQFNCARMILDGLGSENITENRFDAALSYFKKAQESYAQRFQTEAELRSEMYAALIQYHTDACYAKKTKREVVYTGRTITDCFENIQDKAREQLLLGMWYTQVLPSLPKAVYLEQYGNIYTSFYTAHTLGNTQATSRLIDLYIQGIGYLVEKELPEDQLDKIMPQSLARAQEMIQENAERFEQTIWKTRAQDQMREIMQKLDALES